MTQSTRGQDPSLTVDAESQSSSRRDFMKTAAMGLVAGVSSTLLGKPAGAAVTGRKPGKVLIAYYSRTGTTREVASQIQRATGGDLFELKTTHSYPQEYRATTNQARRELDSGFRPKLTAEVQNMAGYDTIFVGYPNWWGTMPMAFFTFLEQHRLDGKTVIPFCTHEGSGLGSSVSDLRQLCPKATLLEGLALRGGGISSVQSNSARRDLADWLKKHGMTI
ncbi:MAG: flavodoxin [Proteobacteria bacterium]|nr:flavodoxin [Pseudomonadota bacterium]